MEKLPGGFYPVMLTPFTAKGELDLEALDALVNVYIEAGANGLFANCLSSDMYELSDEERLKITEQTIKSAKGRVPVVSTGTFGKSEDETVTFFKQLSDLGTDAVVINSNQLCDQEASDETFWGLVENLMNKTEGIGLGVYECPVPHKRLLSPEIIGKMAASGRFLYFKDTSCDIDNIKSKLDKVVGTNFGFFNANIPTAYDSMEYGAIGLSPIGANYYPELYAYYCNNFFDPSKKEQIKKLDLFLTVIDPLIDQCYPFSPKWVLQKRGFKMDTFTRKKYTPFSAQDYIKFEKLINICDNMMEELSIASVIK